MKPGWLPAPSTPAIREGEAHVWCCDFSGLSDFAVGAEVLSEAEKQRAARFKTEEASLTFIGSHIFLRRVLGSYLGLAAVEVRFSSAGSEKPRLDERVHASDLQFNLSHSHRSAACVIARGIGVGIDLEWPDPRLCDEDTARQVFGPEELRYLEECDPSDRIATFFRGWTKKEAYAKCKGTGLSSDLPGVATGFDEGDSRFGGLSLLSFQTPNTHIAALAVEGPPGPITFWTFPPERLNPGQ